MSYKGNQIAQGRDAAKELLKADTALYSEIEEAVKAALEADAVGGVRKKAVPSPVA
jgi:recombination protein RecA